MSLVGVTGPGVLDTSTTTGTGAYTLAGAVSGYQSVGAVLANGDTGYFAAIGVDTNGNRNGDGWEEFYGTYTAAGTSLARTSVLKSSNSNNAVSWPAGTRRITLIDLPAKSKGLNSVVLGGLTLPNPKFVRIQGVNLATGDNDLYTVPAGRRLWVGQGGNAYNGSAGSITYFIKLKVGATYYRLSTSNTLAASVAGGAQGGIVLEPGDIYSVNVATTNGLNIAQRGIEFDSVCPFFSPRLLTLAAGNQTLYTCPTGKSAILVSNQANLGAAGSGFIIGDGTGQNVLMHLVPSGQTVGTTYQLLATTAVSANSMANPGLSVSLSGGDFININVSAGAPPIAWLNVAEIGN
jgi:hypothetical protein